MKTYCGLSRLLILLVAAAFCLTLAVPASQADFTSGGKSVLHIGPGVQDPCYNGTNTAPDGTADGICGILNPPGGSVNVILGDTLNIFDNEGSGGELESPIFLILGVPVEDLLANFFDPQPPDSPHLNDPLTANSIVDPGKLVDASLLPCAPNCGDVLNNAPDVDVAFPDTFPFTWPLDQFTPALSVLSGFTQGKLFAEGASGATGTVGPNTDIYDFLGLPTGGGTGGGGSNQLHKWQDAEQTIPALVLGGEPDDFFRPSGFHIFIYTLNTDAFGSKDAIHLDWLESEIPLGTWVVGWGIAESCQGGGPNADTTPNCDATPYFKSMTEAGFLMPLCDIPGAPGCDPGGEVPEPTSLLLLGSGLLAVGRQWRKRQRRAAEGVGVRSW